MSKKLLAEGLGTFWLVFGGCGSAVLAAAFPDVGIGLLGVSAAFGLTVLTMAYTIRPRLGMPSQSRRVGRPVGRRSVRRARRGALRPRPGRRSRRGAALLLLVASGKPGFDIAGGLAANGVGLHSPGGYSMTAGFVMEVVMTAMFLVIIMGSTERRAARRLRADRHRARAHAHPSGQHSGHQHVGQPGAKHGAGPRRRWVGAAAALGLLGRAADRRGDRWIRLPPVRRRERRPGCRDAAPRSRLSPARLRLCTLAAVDVQLSRRPVGVFTGREETRWRG